MDDGPKLTELEHKTKAKIEEALQILNVEVNEPMLDNDGIQYIATHVIRLVQTARQLAHDQRKLMVRPTQVEAALQS
ncbi:hypothetical protein LTR95_019663, partial [Oleoguttula sp. CCFEE 5521]